MRSEELKMVINDNYGQFTQHIKDDKPSELATSLYTDDAKFYPPNGGMVEGIEGVTKAFKGLIEAGLIIRSKAPEEGIFRNHAYEYSIGTVSDREGNNVRQEQYVYILRSIDGGWKIYRDLVQVISIE